MGNNTHRIQYGRHWVDEVDADAVRETILSSLITTGPKVEEAEKKLCEYTGSKYAVLVSSGTAALHCACIAAGIEPGDEVITTPLTFAASANCILYCGGKPVFADVNPETYNIDPDCIRDCITEKTKAVIAVDFTGQAVEIDKIRDICDEYNLVFIEDAAHSIGTKYNGKQVGSLADMTTFSFHPVKTITSGEGGAILTDDVFLFKKLMLARTHGITHNPDEMENVPDGEWYYEQISLGYNYRITDFQAALLISQMRRLDEFVQRRKLIASKYDEAFRDLPGIIVQSVIPQSDTCRHIYIIRIDEEVIGCSRKEFFEALKGENIVPQIHYIPVYWFPFYKKLGYEKGICPNAEMIYKTCITIPLFPKMTDDDIDRVIISIKKLANKYMIR